MFLAEGTTTQQSGSFLYSLLPIILMFAVLYFLLIRPQQKRSKTRNMMLGGLKKGDKVVTIGGLHGTIMEINDETVVLRVNDATKLTFDRSAINSVSASAPAPVAAPAPEKK
ncbi:preprotein translocase subunit YajC [Paenibacillus aurantius]|uniref:Preprotein translocase subunit YajC n=1 Tax=Paenibacillus aurantius TaxID=2918900 RepID=A0AA96RHM6_9BACL|nr:preprotein translocase subunit YajC [Paenibacillus aurantius]WJH37409.1 preprotein translocase subunit YajC [Paenibacillus sp. CC-CFT747]WNQ14187.1 preprotein translocase subunit YajC [Paenibacillus aurantius]